MEIIDILKHFTFVVIGNVPYRYRMVTSRHIITSRLSMSANVYYVEPTPGIFAAFQRDERHRYTKWVRKGVAEEAYNLKVICPPPTNLPMGGRSRGIDAMNQYMLTRTLAKVLARDRVRNFILWSFAYNSDLLMQYLRPDVSVYHCIDRWSETMIPFSSKSMIDDLEQMTIRTANLVFTSSGLLHEQISRIKKETYYMPNGVDFKLFHTAMRTELQLPDDIKDIPSPRVGYVGILEHWLDIDLLEYLARTMPDVQFVFIGRYGPWLNIDPLMRFKNVHFLGARPRSSIPAYLKGMDACLIPFKLNELTIHSHPLKIYEYLAAGKSVVSTPIHEINKFSDFVYIAGSREGFQRKLRAAISDKDINQANARAEIARHYSWKFRLDEMLERINQFIIGEEARF